MTSGISDPWQSTGFVLALSGCQMNLAEAVIGASFGDARTARGELVGAFLA
jgi:hypothetical protein